VSNRGTFLLSTGRRKVLSSETQEDRGVQVGRLKKRGEKKSIGQRQGVRMKGKPSREKTEIKNSSHDVRVVKLRGKERRVPKRQGDRRRI